MWVSYQSASFFPFSSVVVRVQNLTYFSDSVASLGDMENNSKTFVEIRSPSPEIIGLRHYVLDSIALSASEIQLPACKMFAKYLYYIILMKILLLFPSRVIILD